MLSIFSYADLRCPRGADFFAAASFAGFLPSIGSSISFWPAAFFGFLAGLDACSWPMLARSASIRLTTLPTAGRAFARSDRPFLNPY